jgi:hypothetical protein
MDQATATEKSPRTGPSAERTQGSHASRNRAWSRHKDEIYKFYILNNNTLSATIEHFRKTYFLKAWSVETTVGLDELFQDIFCLNCTVC